MCEETGSTAAALAAAPRPAPGPAVDPVTLEPVDEVTVTMLVDNAYDALMADVGPARRAGFGRTPPGPAAVFESRQTLPGLVAEHGFSALVTVRTGGRVHTVLFDTGISPDGMATNMERLGIDAGLIEAVVVSHSHFDHAGGLEGLARLRRRAGLPIAVHPLVWSRRRTVFPGQTPWELPVLSRAALAAEGFEVIERRQPSLLLGGSVLITGEVDRTTDFETGMPYHEALTPDGAGGRWEPDPLILDDQALVVHVRGRGLLVLTGCGHAGVVNIARHAARLTGVGRVDAVLGGFHLTGNAFEPIIGATVDALTALAPSLVVPAHCTGWKAQHRLAAALPDAFVPNAVGTTYTLAAA